MLPAMVLSLADTGKTVAIPLNHESLTKLFNTPRPDAYHMDLSSPVKLGLTISARGKAQRSVLPSRLENELQGNTYYRKATGSKEFHELIT